MGHRTGWTQDELAKVEGESKRRYIGYMLKFGAFLAFGTDRAKAKNLTEWKFRSYWERTDKGDNDRQRFAEARLPRQRRLTRYGCLGIGA